LLYKFASCVSHSLPLPFLFVFACFAIFCCCFLVCVCVCCLLACLLVRVCVFVVVVVLFCVEVAFVCLSACLPACLPACLVACLLGLGFLILPLLSGGVWARARARASYVHYIACFVRAYIVASSDKQDEKQTKTNNSKQTQKQATHTNKNKATNQIKQKTIKEQKQTTQTHKQCLRMPCKGPIEAL